ncbi:hypothetical protein Purlil1_6602 [Purpureocillium lilacinum]|uniref:Uncharacterized protein n=1 Tax=Purpureocillium lilacinum TaxID=33203 RepID=A0ABR0BYU0_PURLI|nr:hypothetical protein Purlil1_6602 [Purpureocillium lilacinum]
MYAVWKFALKGGSARTFSHIAKDTARTFPATAATRNSGLPAAAAGQSFHPSTVSRAWIGPCVVNSREWPGNGVRRETSGVDDAPRGPKHARVRAFNEGGGGVAPVAMPALGAPLPESQPHGSSITSTAMPAWNQGCGLAAAAAAATSLTKSCLSGKKQTRGKRRGVAGPWTCMQQRMPFFRQIRVTMRARPRVISHQGVLGSEICGTTAQWQEAYLYRGIPAWAGTQATASALQVVRARTGHDSPRALAGPLVLGVLDSSDWGRQFYLDCLKGHVPRTMPSTTGQRTPWTMSVVARRPAAAGSKQAHDDTTTEQNNKQHDN